MFEKLLIWQLVTSFVSICVLHNVGCFVTTAGKRYFGGSYPLTRNEFPNTCQGFQLGQLLDATDLTELGTLPDCLSTNGKCVLAIKINQDNPTTHLNWTNEDNTEGPDVVFADLKSKIGTAIGNTKLPGCVIVSYTSEKTFLYERGFFSPEGNELPCKNYRMVCMGGNALKVTGKRYYASTDLQNSSSSTFSYTSSSVKNVCTNTLSIGSTQAIGYRGFMQDDKDALELLTVPDCSSKTPCILPIDPNSQKVWDTDAAGSLFAITYSRITIADQKAFCYLAYTNNNTNNLVFSLGQQQTDCIGRKVLCMQYGNATAGNRKYFAGDFAWDGSSSPASYNPNLKNQCYANYAAVITSPTDVYELANGTFCSKTTQCIFIINPTTNLWDVSLNNVAARVEFNAISLAINAIQDKTKIICVYGYPDSNMNLQVTIETIGANCLGKRVLCMITKNFASGRMVTTMFLFLSWLSVICVNSFF